MNTCLSRDLCKYTSVYQSIDVRKTEGGAGKSCKDEQASKMKAQKGSLPRLTLQLLLFAAVRLNFIVSGQGKNPAYVLYIRREAMKVLRMHTEYLISRSSEEERHLYFRAIFADMRLAAAGGARWSQLERGVRGERPEARTRDGREPRNCARYVSAK